MGIHPSIHPSSIDLTSIKLYCIQKKEKESIEY